MNNINILAIDTSLEHCSVALQYEQVIQEIFSDSSKERSKKLIDIIEKCLSGRELEELHALAFAAGPGSLTGLKVGSSIIQAISTVYDLPIIKVSTLQALALQAYEELPLNFKLNLKFIMPCIDAKMNQVYYGIYKINNKHVQSAPPEQEAPAEQQDQLYSSTLIPVPIHFDTLGRWENINFLNENNKIKEDIISPKDEILLVGDNSWLDKQNLPENIVSRVNIYNKLIQYSAKNIVKIADYLYKNYVIISKSRDAIPLYIRSYD